MDYSNLSDDELQKMYEERLKGLSDEQLQKLDSQISQPTQAQAQAQEPARPQTIKENHPDISFLDRFKVKNFGSKKGDSLKYLQKRYPNHAFEIDPQSNKILMRGADESEFRYIDRPGFDLQDLTDIAYDTGSGIVEGAGTAAAALGGAAFGGGLGGIPAAVGASGGLSAASDATRQGLGNLLGISDGYDPRQTATAGAFGAAIPFAFGGGATRKGAAKITQKTLGGRSADQLIDAQRGLLGRGFKAAKQNVAPKIGELVSGTPADTILHASRNLGKIKDAQGSSTKGVELITDVREGFQEGIRNKYETIGNKLGDSINSNIKVNPKTAQEPLDDLLKKYEALAPKSKANTKDYEHVKKVVENYRYGDDQLSGREVQDYLNTMNDLSLVRKGSDIGKKSKVDQDITRAAKRVAGNIDEQASQGVDGQKYKAFKQEYKRLKQIDDNVVKKWFGDDHKAESTIRNVDSRQRRVRKAEIEQAAKELGIKKSTGDKVQQILANTAYVDPSFLPFSTQGVTSTSRSVPAAAAGGLLGYYLGNKALGGSGGGIFGAAAGSALGNATGGPAAIKKYMQANHLLNEGANAIQQLGPRAGAFNTAAQVGANAGTQQALDVWNQIRSSQ